MTAPRYDRAPSPRFRCELSAGGWLAPLLSIRTVAGVSANVHLREDDVLTVYAGGAGVLSVRSIARGAVVRAHRTYAKQKCGDRVFRDGRLRKDYVEAEWRVSDLTLVPAIADYLAAVAVGPTALGGEGAVQSAWSAVRAPWTPFDREAVLGYPDKGRLRVGRRFPEVEAARACVDELRLATARRWARMKEGKVGAELDQIAIDAEGRLVFIELKDAAARNSEGVYYAPLQLLQYVYEWRAALEHVRPALIALRAAQIELGLTPATIPALGEGVRPVIAFGADRRSAEVRARFEAVLMFANRHLPKGVPAIEVWAMENGSPTRIG